MVLTSLMLLNSCGNTKEIDQSINWSISLNKGGCMDVCDAYQISINKQGSYNYNGVQNVKHLGPRAGELQVDDLQYVEELLESIDWSNLEKEYGSPGPGVQRKELIYTVGMERVTIVYYRIEPQEIRNLEQLIDQIIDNDEL